MNAKRRRFVIEYCIDYNATQAAIRSGYSKGTAHAQGPRLLENDEIQQAIHEREIEVSKAAAVTVERVLVGLLKEAEFDGKGASHSARVNAWQAIGKHLGMFTDRLEAKVDVGDMANRILEAQKQALATVGGGDG